MKNVERFYVNPEHIITMSVFEEDGSYGCRIVLAHLDEPLYVSFPSSGEREQFIKQLNLSGGTTVLREVPRSGSVDLFD